MSATLWDEIASRLPAAEIDEVKHLFGSQLIDDNQSLQSELSALREMYQSMQKQTQLLSQHYSLVQSTQRSVVESHLRFLLGRLSNSSLSSHSESRNASNSLHPEGHLELQRWVLSKPSSEARSADDSLSRPASSLSAESSMRSDLFEAGISDSAELAALRNTFQNRQHSAALHRLRQHFQEAFEAENAALLADIEHMQMCLAEQADEHAHAQQAPPSLSALQDYCTKLEAELHEDDTQKLHQARMQRLEEMTSQVTIQSDPLRSSSSSLWSEPSGSSLRHSISKRPDTAFEGAGAVLHDPSTVSAPNDCTYVSSSRPCMSPEQTDVQHSSRSSKQQPVQTAVSKSAVCKTVLLHNPPVRPKLPGRNGGRSQPSPKIRQLSQQVHS